MSPSFWSLWCGVLGSGSHQLPGGLWRKELEQEKAEEAPGAATFTEGLELKPASYGQGLPMGSGTHLLPGDKTGNSPGAGGPWQRHSGSACPGGLVGFCDVCLQLLDPHFQESSSSHFLRGLKGNTGPGQCGLARLAVTGIFLALLWFLSIWHLLISTLLSKLKNISVFLYLYHENRYNIFGHHLEMWEHETSTIIKATVFLPQKLSFLLCRKKFQDYSYLWLSFDVFFSHDLLKVSPV